MSIVAQKDLRPLFANTGRSLNLALFGSGAGTNLKALLEQPDPLFKVKTIFADRKCPFLEIGRSACIPTYSLSFQTFIKNHAGTNQNGRDAYDMAIIELLKNEPIDLVLLAGYMRLVQKPLLERFPQQILNVHPADLAVQDERGLRQYVGARGLELALQAGETSTRSTVILVDEGVDTGSILVRGPSLSYTEGFPLTPEKIALHQRRQKQISDWPACKEAIRMIAQGRVSLDSKNRVYIDGNLSPNGVSMEKAVTR